MNLRLIRLITLIIGSIVVISTWEGVLFMAANAVGAIFNGEAGSLGFIVYLQVLCLLSPVAAIIIAWFKGKTGALLVTLSGALLFFEPGWWTEGEMFWQPYALIVVGLLLIYITYSKKYKLKEVNT